MLNKHDFLPSFSKVSFIYCLTSGRCSELPYKKSCSITYGPSLVKNISSKLLLREVNCCHVHEYSDCRLNLKLDIYEGWNFNSGNYLFTTDTK